MTTDTVTKILEKWRGYDPWYYGDLLDEALPIAYELEAELGGLVNKYSDDGQAYQGLEFWKDRLDCMERQLTSAQQENKRLREFIWHSDALVPCRCCIDALGYDPTETDPFGDT